jgi:hypothetical protein
MSDVEDEGRIDWSVSMANGLLAGVWDETGEATKSLGRGPQSHG